MQAARYHGNRDVRIEEVAEPDPDPGEVVVDVETCGICGSDLGEYLYGPRYDDPDRLPYTMGHEVSGTVAETTDGVDIDVGTEVVLNPLVACGDCRQCDEAQYNLCENLRVIGAQRPGGYAERVTVPAGNVITVPDGVTLEMAAVAEPFAVAFHAVRKSPLSPGDTVAVVGMGPIGLGLVQIAKAVGADTVVASGHREVRRTLADECGADVVVDPRESTLRDRIHTELGDGVDVAYEVAGNESALNDAIKAARVGGHATLVGVYKGTAEIDPMDLVNDERSINASAAYQTGPMAARDFAPILRRFETGDLDPHPLVTSTIDLASIVDEGFEALADSQGGEVKVLVRP